MQISYQVPAYKLNGVLVYFAGYKKHIEFYPGAAAIAAFEAEIAVYKYAKGSVQFPLNKPLPIKLIKRIVAFCKVENRTKGKQQVKNKTPKKQLFFGRSTFF
ncbi:MAG: iron chaperone [Ferruginibacter sp.]